MFAIFNCCCSGVPLPPRGKPPRDKWAWCCSSKPCGHGDWVAGGMAMGGWPCGSQVSICPRCSLWALLCVFGTTTSMLEAPVETKNTTYRASSLALAFQLLLEPPIRRRGAVTLGEMLARRAHLGTSHLSLLSCRSDATLAICLSLLVWHVYRALQLQRARYYYYSYILNIILCI